MQIGVGVAQIHIGVPLKRTGGTMSDHPADVALIGLAVMGQNLALNMADHGFRVAVYNRTGSVTDRFIEKHPPGSFGGKGGGLVGCQTLEGMVASMGRPRRVVMMIKAGGPTDAVIDALTPLLEDGDLIVDGGNAHWEDTQRREQALKDRGILFVGSGVSGGEEGARFGPSLMPGGDRAAWAVLKPVWEGIAARVDSDTGRPIEGAKPGEPVEGGESCAAYIGKDGAGHFVKMVHNGIEYADMQIICEAFDLMRSAGGMDPEACAAVFSEYNEGDLDSFLIEITADILRQKDPTTGAPFVDIVLDAAGQKGTGMWTSIAALQKGAPAATIVEAVCARSMSALKEERVRASGLLPGPSRGDAQGAMERHFGTRERLVDAVGNALYCAKLCAYAQGFQIMTLASEEYEWDLDFGSIAMIWRGGCIIRARFLQRIKDAYGRDGSLANLLLDPYFAGQIEEKHEDWRVVVSMASEGGVPVPAFASALSYYDSYRRGVLPANLLQAQRDYFGAHTYERTDQPRGKKFHLDWPDPERPQSEA